jgi:hypothetical protein
LMVSETRNDHHFVAKFEEKWPKLFNCLLKYMILPTFWTKIWIKSIFKWFNI